MEERAEKQHNNSYDWLKEYSWQKGQSGNPKGRPKTKTLKEFAREFLSNMSEEGRIEYFSKIDPEVVWKMAEGNPETKQETTVILPTPIAPIDHVQTNNSLQEDTKSKEENPNSAGGNFSIEDNLNLNLLDSQSTDGQNTNTN